MNKKWIMVVLIFILIIFGFSFRSIAGCKSDCLDEYESEVDSCQMQYDDPEDAEMLQTCIDGAKGDYDSCIDECEN